MSDKRQHDLVRTSKKGELFLGKCVWCGMTDLPSQAVWQECPDQNPPRQRFKAEDVSTK